MSRRASRGANAPVGRAKVRKGSKASVPAAGGTDGGGGGGMVLGKGVDLNKMLGWDLRLARVPSLRLPHWH